MIILKVLFMELVFVVFVHFTKELVLKSDSTTVNPLLLWIEAVHPLFQFAELFGQLEVMVHVDAWKLWLVNVLREFLAGIELFASVSNDLALNIVLKNSIEELLLFIIGVERIVARAGDFEFLVLVIY